MLGWKTVCAVELNSYCARRLLQRQNEGHLPPFPVWDNVCTFDGRPWKGLIDVVAGGFPCQDISIAGKGGGIDSERSGLWKEMFRIICEVRPRYAFVENSPLLTRRGIDRVLGNLASMGFDAIWGVLGADNVGAPHIRKRIWILAYTRYGHRRSVESGTTGFDCRKKSKTFGTPKTITASRSSKRSKVVAHAYRMRKLQSKGSKQNFRRRTCNRSEEISHSNDFDDNGRRFISSQVSFEQATRIQRGEWWAVEPPVGRVVNGMAARLDQLRAIGNGQVPAVVCLAWRALLKLKSENLM
ncbi:DNA cytosine methyltransferase [Leptospira yasudae]|uniref:DNA cytosine methyltransferase n=1 Tax=Leptospira yasudae TaxID=2202201 RepID=UPI001F4D3D9A|nr:DNA cytosine methyltransferase [Leptospira yasudae]